MQQIKIEKKMQLKKIDDCMLGVATLQIAKLLKRL